MATLAPSVTLEDIKPVSFQPLFVERSELEQKQASHAFCTAVQYDGPSPCRPAQHAHASHICTGTDWAHPCQIFPGTGLTQPHLPRERAQPAHL